MQVWCVKDLPIFETVQLRQFFFTICYAKRNIFTFHEDLEFSGAQYMGQSQQNVVLWQQLLLLIKVMCQAEQSAASILPFQLLTHWHLTFISCIQDLQGHDLGLHGTKIKVFGHCQKTNIVKISNVSSSTVKVHMGFPDIATDDIGYDLPCRRYSVGRLVSSCSGKWLTVASNKLGLQVTTQMHISNTNTTAISA